jgi:hypothetical protein
MEREFVMWSANCNFKYNFIFERVTLRSIAMLPITSQGQEPDLKVRSKYTYHKIKSRE